MVHYEIFGTNGESFYVVDYCFRGLYKEFRPNGVCELTSDKYDSGSDEIYKAYSFARESLYTVVYHEFIPIFKEVIESTPWLKEGIVSYDEETVTVRGDMEGDRIFHTLSTLRNLRDYYGGSYNHYREELGLSPKESLFIQMFITHYTNWEGRVVYEGQCLSNDYMWCNSGSITIGAARSLWENGPIWRQDIGSISNDFSCKSFVPSVIDEMLTEDEDEWEDEDDEDIGEVSSIDLLRMYHSFELDREVDKCRTLLFSNGNNNDESVLDTLLSIIKGK